MDCGFCFLSYNNFRQWDLLKLTILESNGRKILRCLHLLLNKKAKLQLEYIENKVVIFFSHQNSQTPWNLSMEPRLRTAVIEESNLHGILGAFTCIAYFMFWCTCTPRRKESVGTGVHTRDQCSLLAIARLMLHPSWF